MTKFAETPEGRKYLTELQEGRPDDIGPPGSLEGQTFKLFQERRRRAGTIMAERDRVLKQVADGEERVKALTRQGDLTTGEATAFAEILLAAEEARRITVEPKPGEEGVKIAGKANPDDDKNGDPENEDKTTPDPQSEMAKQPRTAGLGGNSQRAQA